MQVLSVLKPERLCKICVIFFSTRHPRETRANVAETFLSEFYGLEIKLVDFA